jgi:hypothetical protein
VVLGIESQPVGVISSRNPRHDPERSFIDGDHFIGSRGAGVDAPERRYGENAVNLGNIWNVSHQFLRVGIEGQHVALAQVRDEEQAGLGIHALVVESRGSSRQRNIADKPQRQRRRRRRRAGAPQKHDGQGANCRLP